VDPVPRELRRPGERGPDQAHVIALLVHGVDDVPDALPVIEPRPPRLPLRNVLRQKGPTRAVVRREASATAGSPMAASACSLGCPPIELGEAEVAVSDQMAPRLLPRLCGQ
jgi:hypothetical protein